MSDLSFDSTDRELSFAVSGPSGTAGYIEVAIAKSLVEDLSDVEVKLNDEEVDYTITSLDDSCLLYLTYLHSTHEVTITLGYKSIPFVETPRGKAIVYGIPIAVAVILIVLYALRRRQQNP